MKYTVIIFITVTFLLAGCQYEAPLTEEHDIAIDPAVLGLWEPAEDEDDRSQPNERLMILKFSDTEYLIHYPLEGNNQYYYRGYLIEIGGVQCVQLQAIGSDSGSLPEHEKKIFQVVSYKLADDRLVIKILNNDLVDNELKTTEDLKELFLKHKNNENLFREPGVFRRFKIDQKGK